MDTIWIIIIAHVVLSIVATIMECLNNSEGSVEARRNEAVFWLLGFLIFPFPLYLFTIPARTIYWISCLFIKEEKDPEQLEQFDPEYDRILKQLDKEMEHEEN